ncbi:MAG: ABC transporter substrate-binding protein, partial [Lachnospiraceae bacterium]|nr:ABC transporter substrate-binding protein [Lachnospiraceae bacterium]
MKQKKFIFISALSVILLSACSSDKAVSETAKLYNIGAIIPVTGDNKDLGISIKQGAMLAIDEINENGGIDNGEEYRLDLVVANDESESKYADYAYESIKKDGIHAVIGLIENEECSMLSLTNFLDNM